MSIGKIEMKSAGTHLSSEYEEALATEAEAGSIPPGLSAGGRADLPGRGTELSPQQDSAARPEIMTNLPHGKAPQPHRLQSCPGSARER
jgi:hypothetical protein